MPARLLASFKDPHAAAGAARALRQAGCRVRAAMPAPFP